MCRNFWTATLFLAPLILWAQLSEDFSDGNINENWKGTTSRFIVENQMLRLYDDQAGHSWLVTPSGLIANTRWEFWMRLAFTPTSSNHPRIYLTSDSPDLSGALNGYFIQVGKDGSDNKRLFLYRQDGESLTELLRGWINFATASNNIMRIRVHRDAQGTWELWADPQGGSDFLPQGMVTDDVHQATSWFGISCHYTVTNSRRFYFDDLYAGPIVNENEPFVVEQLLVTSAASLQVYFNREPDPASAQQTIHYEVSRGVGHPMAAAIHPEDPRKIDLIFPQAFSANLLYELHIHQLKDQQGRLLEPFSGEFMYCPLNRFDVVFNELMVDPNPPVGLPAHEYIELYNSSGHEINLEGWILQHGSSRRLLPAAVIPAKGLLLLTSEQGVAALEPFGRVVGVPGLAATALVNSGTSLLLYDQDENLISFVSYTDKWYQDPPRSGGGWSLEKIDPYNFCEGASNWRASQDPKGGTPGAANSVLAKNPDVSAPQLLRAGYVDSLTISLFFSEPMDEASSKDKLQYQVVPEAHSASRQGWNPRPLTARPLLPDFSKIELRLEQPLLPDVIYVVHAARALTDCAGNALQRNEAFVAIPAVSAPHDVVINEVLFNPAAGGERYLELYNASNGKVIELKDHVMASKDTLQGFLTSVREISSESLLFFPGTYLVLTPDAQRVKSQYMTPNPWGFIETATLPGMTNSRGVVLIANRGLSIIDMLAYHEDMHSPLLRTPRGVALERINPLRPSQDRANWHSAAQATGFGTPGYRNSQFARNLDNQQDPVEIFPEIFSPDGDGQDDVLNISYCFNEPGKVANIRIFDSRGRLIRLLRHGELLATQGVITWDGATDQMQKAPLGLYIIQLEVFDAAGNVDHYRKTAVLAGRSW